MFWVLLGAVVGSTIAIIYLVWRKWIAPWRQVDRLVRQIGRGERPQTFLVEGAKEAQRVSVALEDIFSRQRELDRQAGERAAGQKAIFSAMQDGLLVVDRDRRIVLANLAFHETRDSRARSAGRGQPRANHPASQKRLLSVQPRVRRLVGQALVAG